MDIYMLNPLTRVINIYRDLLVDGAFPAARDLLFVTLATVVLFTLGCLVFWRLEPRFAEEV
jgi:lipopolysaccharide transport system permease protein